MLNITKELIEDTIKIESDRVNQVVERLREHGDDGDKMDDPAMFADHGDLLAINRRLTSLKGESIRKGHLRLDEIDYETQIGIYSEIDVHVLFLDDQTENWKITIGSSEDAAHIHKWEHYKNFFDDEKKHMISTKSPLAIILIGKSVGQKIPVKIGDLKTVYILKTSLSKLAFGYL